VNGPALWFIGELSFLFAPASAATNALRGDHPVSNDVRRPEDAPWLWRPQGFLSYLVAMATDLRLKRTFASSGKAYDVVRGRRIVGHVKLAMTPRIAVGLDVGIQVSGGQSADPRLTKRRARPRCGRVPEAGMGSECHHQALDYSG
jgi:hypothetical protein